MDTFEVVSVEDPALDREKMQVRKYAETRDPALIVEKLGARAVRWTLRDLTKSESDMCDDRGSVSITSKLNFTLAFGLVKVETGAKSYVPTKSAPDAERGGTKGVWGNEEIAELQRLFGKSVLREIAMVISQRDERVGEAFGGGVPSFTLLPSSLDALVRMGRPPAG